MAVLNRKRHESGQEYVAYQELVTLQHVLPLLEKLGANFDRPVLDVGCGKGGCAITVAKELGVPVHGIDILQDDVDVARESAKNAEVEATFEVLNLLEDPLPDLRPGIMLMRDVVEHLPDVELVLSRLRPLAVKDAALYVTFPPWRGPYAGHQHNARSFARFMPYLHSVAPGLFLKLLERWESDREDWLEDERQICQNRLTRRKFERAARAAGWEIRYRQTYFLRPAFLRMGLPIIPNGFVGRLPLIGERLTTACEYLLVPEGQPERRKSRATQPGLLPEVPVEQPDAIETR